MITVREALDRVLREVVALPAEEVPLAAALGRVLAEDVTAVLDVPRWDNSAMDGYAVRAADTSEDEVALVLNEVIGAGYVPVVRVASGTASAIMTGAPMPEGADAVVMVEDTDGSQEGTVQIRGKATPGLHIRRRGEDIHTGDLLLSAGDRLGPAALGLAASQGREVLSVSRRPVVAILSTGDEVVPPGQPLQPGQLYSSNNASLAGLVTRAGGVPLDGGTAPDDLAATVGRLEWCIAQADAVLTSGGVSVGEFDVVKQAFADLGVPLDFWRVKMKPGKPLAFGVAVQGGRRVPVFGLPGNPVSCMVNFLEIVRPWMHAAMGTRKPFLPVVEAIAAEDIRVSPGRLDFTRVTLEDDKGRWCCHSTGNQSSAVLTSMVRAHGLALFPPGSEGARAGEVVRVQLLDPSFLDRDDPGLP
ncbi:MAG: molybdopterin molybdotransferase MoeA [Deltaproteobacteria bacterium]|nr:molybdopterin molybdotransferase MoeA [Deltaproteobacteria bacterium]